MKRVAWCFLPLMLLTNIVSGQSDDKIIYPVIGKVQPRHSREITSSNWAIGCETMDRDLVEFECWKDHLGPLGTKQIRLQAGWTRCEKQKGVYDFEWLDEVIDCAVAQGVKPWLQTSYGNPIYEGGGGIHLSGGIPSSEEALNAWDNWVTAMAKRYKGKVPIWEIWNEPDNKKSVTPEDYAAFYIRTAEIIRGIDPDAIFYALSIANTGKGGLIYADTFLSILKKKGKLHLINDITLHGYTFNPSSVYKNYEKWLPLIRKYSNDINIRQGELGCPSEHQTIYALCKYDWTELSQSKWVIRKMMGDLGRDIPSSYFLLVDIVYTHDHEVLMKKPQRNTKGLIKTDINKKFVSLKQSYFAYQTVTSIFDDTLERIPNYPYKVNSEASLSLFGYRLKHFDSQAVVVWLDGETPTNSNKKTPMTFEFPAGCFKKPMLVDLRNGNVFDIPKKDWSVNGTSYKFENMPVYDSPILIADRTLIKLK